MIRCVDRLFGNIWGVIFGWQLCVITTCLGGTILSYKARYYGNTIPLLNLASTYFFIWICNVWWWPKGNSKWWGYILVACTIVTGDCINLMAYNMTSLASVIVIVSTVIFWVAPLSYFVFKRTINCKQFFAMLIAAAGVSLVMVAQGTKDSHLWGNLVALGSAVCFAITNITQEYVVKDNSIRLYLCRFSSIAWPIAAILSGSLEWKMIKEYKWDTRSILCQIGYPIVLGSYYMFSPFILQHSDATVMNLSLMTNNFVSLAIDILFFGRPFNWLYILGFCFIPIAVAIFVLCETKKESKEGEITPSIEQSLVSQPGEEEPMYKVV